MAKFNLFISRYFGVILLSSALSGLFMPVFRVDTSLIIVVSLATVIFASFFKVTVDKSLFTSDWGEISIYFIIRFVVLPVAIYFLVSLINPFYAVVTYFIMVLPSAVSSPAFSAMNEGSVPLALKILIFTNFVTIVTIPILSKLVLTQKLEIDSLHIFLMMVYTVVVPFVFYLPLRNVTVIKNAISKNNPFITALGLMIIFVFSTSKNREIILDNPYKLFIYAAISALILFYFI
jgi:predicted Na+-dependent transporter